MIDSGYIEYNNFLNSIRTHPDLLLNFKTQPSYANMLQHNDYHMGLNYLANINKFFSVPQDSICKFTKSIDEIGGAVCHHYGNGLYCSNISLRYVFQSLLILQYMSKELKLKEVSIVEVGCGYGGLMLALRFFSNLFNIKIKSYSMIDLDGPSYIQEYFLSHFSIEFPVSFVNSETYGKFIEGDDLFLISNYCFSEIGYENQKKYIEHLFPKCSHGFFAWNAIDLYDFGKNYRYEEEYPKTSPKNKYVYF